jgi:hypothetical protein
MNKITEMYAIRLRVKQLVIMSNVSSKVLQNNLNLRNIYPIHQNFSFPILSCSLIVLT